MDTSKEYIEMCRKAKQLREKWVPQKGDLTFSPRDGVVYLDDLIIRLAEMTPFGANGARIRADHIPLWRQDQLQGMVFDKFKEFLGSKNNSFIYDEMLSSFYDFCFNGKTTQEWPWNNYSISMEQLWFAFVMHEKYNKKWSGTDWI